MAKMIGTGKVKIVMSKNYFRVFEAIKDSSVLIDIIGIFDIIIMIISLRLLYSYADGEGGYATLIAVFVFILIFVLIVFLSLRLSIKLIDNPDNTKIERFFQVNEKPDSIEVLNPDDPIVNVGMFLCHSETELSRIAPEFYQEGYEFEDLRNLSKQDEILSLSDYDRCIPVIYAESGKIYPIWDEKNYYIDFSQKEKYEEIPPNKINHWYSLKRLREYYNFDRTYDGYDLICDQGIIFLRHLYSTKLYRSQFKRVEE